MKILGRDKNRISYIYSHPIWRPNAKPKPKPKCYLLGNEVSACRPMGRPKDHGPSLDNSTSGPSRNQIRILMSIGNLMRKIVFYFLQSFRMLQF